VVVMKSTFFWDITPCSPLKFSDSSEEHPASIFRVEGAGRKQSFFRNFYQTTWCYIQEGTAAPSNVYMRYYLK
jgi:hypothetical protein